MRYYETLYIAHPDYEDARLDELKKNVDERIRNHGAEIVNSYSWGKRRLAYEVNKFRYGTYMMLQYSVQKPFIDELNTCCLLYTSPSPRDQRGSGGGAGGG